MNSPFRDLLTRPIWFCVSWSVVAVVAPCCGWFLSVQIPGAAPGEGVTSFEWWHVAYIPLRGVAPGLLLGLGQYAVLKARFPKRSWFPWIFITGIGYVAGWWCGFYLSSHTGSSPISEKLLYTYVPLLTMLGLLLGAAQAPLLVGHLKQRLFWFWPLITTVGFLFSMVLLMIYDHPSGSRTSHIPLYGIGVGPITGFGLLFLLPKVSQVTSNADDH